MQDYINTQDRRRAEANIEMLICLMKNNTIDLKDTIDFFYQIKSGPGLTDADFKCTKKKIFDVYKQFFQKERECNLLISQIPAEEGLKCSQAINDLKQEIYSLLIKFQQDKCYTISDCFQISSVIQQLTIQSKTQRQRLNSPFMDQKKTEKKEESEQNKTLSSKEALQVHKNLFKITTKYQAKFLTLKNQQLKGKEYKLIN